MALNKKSPALKGKLLFPFLFIAPRKGETKETDAPDRAGEACECPPPGLRGRLLRARLLGTLAGTLGRAESWALAWRLPPAALRPWLHRWDVTIPAGVTTRIPFCSRDAALRRRAAALRLGLSLSLSRRSPCRSGLFWLQRSTQRADPKARCFLEPQVPLQGRGPRAGDEEHVRLQGGPPLPPCLLHAAGLGHPPPEGAQPTQTGTILAAEQVGRLAVGSGVPRGGRGDPDGNGNEKAPPWGLAREGHLLLCRAAALPGETPRWPRASWGQESLGRPVTCGSAARAPPGPRETTAR